MIAAPNPLVCRHADTEGEHYAMPGRACAECRATCCIECSVVGADGKRRCEPCVDWAGMTTEQRAGDAR